MDRNEIECNKHSNKKEIERTLVKRDRERYLEELSELEREEASVWGKISGSAFSLVVESTIFSGLTIWVTYYPPLLFSQNPHYWKYTVIGSAVLFTLSLIPLLYYLWKMSSLKGKIVKIKDKLNRIEKDLSRDF